jgi:hypothetical protein
MKKWMLCASALALLGACGVSKDANAALTAMNLADGKAGMVKYASKTGSGDKVTLKDVIISQGEGDGLKASKMVLDGLGLGADGQPVVKSITLSDITPEKVTEGMTLVVKEAGVSSANDVTAAYLAKAFNEGGPGEAPPFEQLAFDRVALSGMNITGDLAKMQMAPSGTFSVDLGELSVSNLKDTVFGAAKFSGFKGAFDVPAEAGAGIPIKGTFDFGTMDLTGVQGKMFADAFAAGMQSATDPSALQAKAFAGLSSPIDPGYTTAKWTPMVIEASGAKLEVTGGASDVTRNAEGVATQAKTPRTAIKFTTNAADGQLGATAGMFLGMLNYQTVELYGQSDAVYDPATDTTRYNGYSFGMTDGFDLQLAGGFQGLTAAMGAIMASASQQPTFDEETGELTPAPGPDMAALEAFKVIDLDLTLTDKSLVNRLLALAPMVGGSDPEAMRADIITQLKSMGADLAGAGVDATVANEFTAAIADFVAKPGTLKIAMKPPAPVALAQEGAQLDKATLGLTITNTPAQ